MISKSEFGLQFLERLQERPKTRDTFFHGSKLTNSRNPFLHDSYSDYNNVESPLTQPSVVTHSIDLFTGDLLFSESISQPEVPNIPERTGSQSGGIIDFHDTYNVDGKFSAPAARAETEDNGDCTDTKHYIDCLKSFFFPRKGKKIDCPGDEKIDFVLAMKLEIVRLRLNLTTVERDRALVSIGIVPATIDPNNLIDESYMIRLCKYIDSLALLGQAAFEDQINGSIGLERVDEDVVDLWNIGEVGETCSSNECEVRAEVKSPVKASSSAYSGQSSQLFLVCSQCGRKTCKVCCAGWGAALLSNIHLHMSIQLQ